MNEETAARQALILKMMRGFPSSQGHVTEGVLASYVSAVEEFPVEAIGHACKRFLTGDVPGHNNGFMPTAAELSEQAKLFADVLAQIQRNRQEEPKLIMVPIGEPLPDGAVPLGPLSIDFGDGKIDMRGMTPDEKEAVLTSKGLPRIDGMPKPKLQAFTAGDADGDREVA